MDWIAPIIEAAGTFLTGLVTNIGTTFTGLFITGTGETAAPSDLATFILSMVGIATSYFILKFTYGIIANFVSSRKNKRAKAKA